MLGKMKILAKDVETLKANGGCFLILYLQAGSIL